MRSLRRAAFVGLAMLASAQVSGAALKIDLGALDHPLFSLEAVSLSISDDAAATEFRIGKLTSGERTFRDLRFVCDDMRVALPRVQCGNGVFQSPDLSERVGIDFDLDVLQRVGSFRLRSSAGGEVALVLGHDGRLVGNLSRVDLSRLAGFFPAATAVQPVGRVDGRVEAGFGSSGRPGMHIEGRLVQGGFSTSDGLKAAQGVAASFSARAAETRTGWSFSADVDWTKGEAYLHPLYFTAGGSLAVRGSTTPDRVDLDRISIGVDGVDAIEARARLRLPDGAPEAFAVAIAGADLGVVGPRFIAPLLAQARPEALSFGGRMSAGVVIEDGRPRSLDLSLDGVRFANTDASLAFGPLHGSVPWRDDAETRAQVRFDGGRWEKLELGGFDLDARLDGPSVEIDELAIPVLDGRVLLTDLALRRSDAGWSGSGGAVIEPISMPLLTTAVGLPSMSGVLSASLPGLLVSPGEIGLDGTLVISVFDGYLRVTDLRAIEPFGVTSRLFSNVEARHLDLEQLTETFAFGTITGFLDADLEGLELLHWRPVRFDARLASSPGRYRKRISQRAVQNIGALAGPGVGVALQRSILGFFETFGYSEIGVSCRLEAGVCLMGGIGDEATGSFDIVRGGGIPALNIIGYNRRVDWNELIDRLIRVIESNSAPVIQ